MKEAHGGNVYLLAETLGIPENEIIDFSASINPLGVSENVRSAISESLQQLFHYPDPNAKRLRAKIAEYVGVNPGSIVCGNGSTELIYLIVRALRPAKVLIPSPTFSEYERACKLPGHEFRVTRFELRKDTNFDIKADEFISAMNGAMNSSFGSGRLSPPFDMVFICNPNNPTGRLISRDSMHRIADAAKNLKCVLVVDEAFIDFCPDATIIDEVSDNPSLVVLRSLTKMYALSGLRVGYAVLPPLFLDAVKNVKEPWTVNTLAQIAGVAALNDVGYRFETLKLIDKEKKVLEEGFTRMGITYLASAANYFLICMENAKELGTYLKKKGILVRDCSNFIGLDSSYVRVAVRSEQENRRLLKEISSWLG